MDKSTSSLLTVAVMMQSLAIAGYGSDGEH